jgi:hypothetical protein
MGCFQKGIPGSMSFLRDLYHFTLELFRFLRKPQAHQEQVRIKTEQNRQVMIQALAERYESLTLKPKLLEEIQNYNQLSEALDFIARCLEQDQPLALLQEMEGAQGHLAYNPDYPYDFTHIVFSQLQDLHREKNLRILYQEQRFPLDKNEFFVGGFDSELWRIHIEFNKADQGRILREFYLSR